jgi:hypothetical protein
MRDRADAGMSLHGSAGGDTGAHSSNLCFLNASEAIRFVILMNGRARRGTTVAR